MSTSEDITNLLPITAQIDQTSIQNALQALASIKTKMYSEETTITPHLMAVSLRKRGAEEVVAEAALAPWAPPGPPE